jgi:hypothetical protein
MTRKDFVLIAEILATSEQYLHNRPAASAHEMLEFVNAEFRIRLKQTNPRFNAGRFMAAAQPLKSKRLAAAVREWGKS